IWIFPRHKNLEPSYEQKRFDAEAAQDKLLPIVVPRNGKTPENAVSVDQDVTVYAGRFSPGKEAKLDLQPNREVWVQIAKGSATVKGLKLRQGDGAAITGENAVSLKAEENAELLLFDLP